MTMTGCIVVRAVGLGECCQFVVSFCLSASVTDGAAQLEGHAGVLVCQTEKPLLYRSWCA
ncbi:hypothetical protein WN71_037180 [Streptomyces mangrovisoli]|uniref:Uncharacterized protein n=1 Tax=Streptomyces mangrovisoli TaxID=1428628 RepID=A0A1J4NKN8_9ACTN|nr:hypothetical protein WN71_037180 [Streptomyces mangrovisoli]